MREAYREVMEAWRQAPLAPVIVNVCVYRYDASMVNKNRPGRQTTTRLQRVRPHHHELIGWLADERDVPRQHVCDDVIDIGVGFELLNQRNPDAAHTIRSEILSRLIGDEADSDTLMRLVGDDPDAAQEVLGTLIRRVARALLGAVRDV